MPISRYMAISIFFLASLSIATFHIHVSAQTPPSINPGSLQAFDNDGNPTGICPLKHTSVKAEISGFTSRVTVTQEFENPFSDKIDALYTFPLPAAAAVDQLAMYIGDRKIAGKIMKRDEAESAFRNAKEKGKVATLLEQLRPNIFSQSLSNILPGQQVRVVISYVETLQYDDGTYEWSFPLAIGPRYTGDPAKPKLPATIAPPPEQRNGHEISIEVKLDTGVPLIDANSNTHEIETYKSDPDSALVRLQDRDSIPNRDFVLKYRVAGDTISDALLTHRSDKGGFFTLILQPPLRVEAADITPKELVFVLDTSGSMAGFPLDKAKETMNLALDNLNPNDTFNIITFAGDTNFLFPAPLPATPENLSKAKEFLRERNGDGGTELMKAVKAALEPSNAQNHLRVACFLTDGQVGNDMEIIAEVKKYPNARVFAMGFGSEPNRFLLDAMTNYGRGEVDYISGTGDSSRAAQRFQERVRNPLVTNLTIDWNGLPVSDVYPSQIPDLFSAKPITVTGRYTKGAKGTIRLQGVTAGSQFVREIPVELPEEELDHDVLATLWARKKVTDLMGQDPANMQASRPSDPLREEITQLGLTYNLMTQFTSFVGIDELVAVPGESRPVNIPVTPYPGSIASNVGGNVTVDAVTSEMSCILPSMVTTVATKADGDTPLLGRSVTPLLPVGGGITPAASRNSIGLSANGRRPSENTFLVDGVSADFGIEQGGQSPGSSASGNAPALTASGGTNGLASLDSLSELTVETVPMNVENQTTGFRTSLITKSGSNKFHGSLFHFFGNDALDAHDSFAERLGLDQPAHHLNNFGGTIGGPISRNKSFFFAAYEGLRLQLPMSALTHVPSLTARQNAPAGVREWLNAFPLPNGAATSGGFSEFAATFSNRATHDVGSLHIDHNFTSNLRLSGRYSFANSDALTRGSGGYSLNTLNRIDSNGETVTGDLIYVMSPNAVAEVRANYSRLKVAGTYWLDSFGGSVVPDSTSGSLLFDLNARNAVLRTGDEVANTQRQFNLVGTFDLVHGSHELKFGSDYRRLAPTLRLRTPDQGVLFSDVDQAVTGVANRLGYFERVAEQRPDFNYFSAYGQDEWRPSTRLTLNYGVRWDINFAPKTPDAQRRSLWKTNFGNLAPRAGARYQLNRSSHYETVISGSAGIAYVPTQQLACDTFTDSLSLQAGNVIFNSPFTLNLAAGANRSTLPVSIFDPALKLPYVFNWTTSVHQSFGYSQTFWATFVSSTGRRLLSTQTLFDVAPGTPLLRVTTNESRSSRRSLLLKFERRYRGKFSTDVSYTLAQSKDNESYDTIGNVIVADPNRDWGVSDLDVRHTLNGLATLQLPTPFSAGLGNGLTRNWTIDSIFTLRSALPLNVLYTTPTAFGYAHFRPDVVPGQPLYLEDSNVPGGRRLNPAAFSAPAFGGQGNLARNSLRGFPLYQFDLGVRRRFEFTERVRLQVQVDAFNVFNIENFEDPLGNDLSIGTRFNNSTLQTNQTFGQSASLKGRSAVTPFAAFNNQTTPRIVRLSLKLTF